MVFDWLQCVNAAELFACNHKNLEDANIWWILNDFLISHFTLRHVWFGKIISSLVHGFLLVTVPLTSFGVAGGLPKVSHCHWPGLLLCFSLCNIGFCLSICPSVDFLILVRINGACWRCRREHYDWEIWSNVVLVFLCCITDHHTQ